MIKIGVVFHKEVPIDEYISNKEIYLPIHVGRESYKGDSKFLLDMIGDNEGKNISLLNQYLNEMTALYWFGNHYNEIGDPDYFGLFHYRRFLKYNENDLNENKIFVNYYDFRQINVYQQILFAECSQDMLNRFINVILEFKPEYKDLMIKFFNEHYLYACNMFIMHKDKFKEYFKFIEFCINVCRIFLNNSEKELEIHPRVFGMFLERMTGFYIYKLQNDGCKIIPCEIIGEQNK